MHPYVRKASLGLLLFGSVKAYSQSNNEPSDYNPHDLKITGYFQMQYQSAAREGILSFAGGDFSHNNKDRFIIRRGRLKFDRVDKYTNVVIQVDATQDGVGLRDGFIQLKDPFFKTFTLTAGQFTKPFGYAPSYSSGAREFPERPRFYQTLMPSERDLGAMITIRPPAYKFIDYEIGVFNGSGTNARDYDHRKDLSTSLNIHFDSLANQTTVAFGASYYHGFVRQNTSTVFNPGNPGGISGFIAQSDDKNIGAYAKRRYKGLHLRVETDGSLGKFSFKTEYVSGKQPGISSSETVTGPQGSRSFNTQPQTDIYNRNFRAGYVWLVKEIPHTQMQVIASYDFYDPNTFVQGRNIGINSSNTSSADVKYQNLGAGMVFYMTKQVKLVLYYDHPVNEKTSLPDYPNELSDDVFTARIQYRF